MTPYLPQDVQQSMDETMRDLVCEWFSKGYSVASIAKALMMSKATIYNMLGNRVKKRRSSEEVAEMRSKAVLMASEGLSPKHVAQTLGVSVAYIKRLTTH